MWVWLQNFAEKTFTDGSETAKNAKVFSLESFPLCGNYDSAENAALEEAQYRCIDSVKIIIALVYIPASDCSQYP